MPTSTQILDTIAPQFVDNADKSTFLSMASDRTSTCAFGKNRDLAVALRAAHMLTLSTRLTGDAGSISSKREGDLSVTYANVSGGDIDLEQTSYGRQLDGLIRSSIMSMSVTNPCSNGLCF